MTLTSVSRICGRFCSCLSLAQVSSHAHAHGYGKRDPLHYLTSLYMSGFGFLLHQRLLVPGQNSLYFNKTVGAPPSDNLSRTNPIWFSFSVSSNTFVLFIVKWNLNKIKNSVPWLLTTFHTFSSHMYLVTIVLDNTNVVSPGGLS